MYYKARYLSLFFKFILSEKLSWSDVLLFSEFINIVSILFYEYWIYYIVAYFLVISFASYKEYVIWLISFSKFSDVLPVFTCASAIDNLWNICLGLIILSPSLFVNIQLMKSLRVNSRPSTRAVALSKVSRFLTLPSFVFGSNRLFWYYQYKWYNLKILLLQIVENI